MATTGDSYPYSKGIWWACMLLGLGLLLPFYAVSTIIPFFETHFDERIGFETSAAVAVPQLLMQPFMLAFGHKTRPLARIIFSALSQVACMALAPSLGIQQRAFLWLICAGIGMGTSIMESSLFGFAGALPAWAMSAVMVGEGVASVGATAAQLLVKWALPGRPAAAAGFYAAVAAAIMAACAAAGLWLRRNGLVKSAGADERKNPFIMFTATAAGRTTAGAGATVGSGTDASSTGTGGAAVERPLATATSTSTSAHSIVAAAPMSAASTDVATASGATAGGGISLLAADAVDSSSVGVDMRPVASLAAAEPHFGAAPGTVAPALVQQLPVPRGSGSAVNMHEQASLASPHASVAFSGAEADTRAASSSNANVSATGTTSPSSSGEAMQPAPPPAWLLAHAGKTDSAGTVARWLIAVIRVLRQMWPAACAIALSFIGTFLVFPGLIATIPYRGESATFREDRGWWTGTLFFLFALADLGGRLFVPRTRVVGQWRVLAYAAVRLLIALPVVGAARGWPACDSDFAAAVSVMAVAATSGHCLTNAMIEAPNAVALRDKELAGTVCTLFLHLGIVLGSLLALGLE